MYGSSPWVGMEVPSVVCQKSWCPSMRSVLVAGMSSDDMHAYHVRSEAEPACVPCRSCRGRGDVAGRALSGGARPARPEARGANDAAGTDQHKVLEDILRFKRGRIRDMGKQLMRKQDQRGEGAPHVQEQERQRAGRVHTEEQPQTDRGF